MKLRSIAALDENRVIGKDGELPWDYPDDAEFFRSKTEGHPMIMGRKSFDDLDGELLDRLNIVLTTDSSLESDHRNVKYVNSVEEALNVAELTNHDLVYVTGGQEIYEQFHEYLDELILTHIHDTHEGDTYYPEFDEDEWSQEVLHDREDFTIIKYT